MCVPASRLLAAEVDVFVGYDGTNENDMDSLAALMGASSTASGKSFLNTTNEAFRNLGGGDFEPMSIGSLTTAPGRTRSAAFADIDNGTRAPRIARVSCSTKVPSRGVWELTECAPTSPAARADGDLDVLIGTAAAWHLPPLYDDSGSGACNGGVNGIVTYVGIQVPVGPDAPGCYPGQRNELHINDGSGNYTLLGGTSLTDSSTILHATSSIAFGDIDGDGFVDVILGTLSLVSGACNTVHRNMNGLTFTHVLGTSVSVALTSTTSILLADADGDGNLDVFAGNWAISTNFGAGEAVLATTPKNNELHLGDGNFGFTQRHATDGISFAASQFSTMAAAWGDYDSDGDLDLIVVNQGSVNELHRYAVQPAWSRVHTLLSRVPSQPAALTLAGPLTRISQHTSTVIF